MTNKKAGHPDSATLTQKVLQKIEFLLPAIFRNMREGFMYCRMLYDEQGRPVDFVYLAVNPPFERILGLKNAAGKFGLVVCPEMRKKNPEMFQCFCRVVSTHKPEKFEIYLKPLKRWIATSVFCPAKRRFAAVFENITERKRTARILQKQRRDLHAYAKDTKIFSQQLIQACERDRRNLSYLLHREAGSLAIGLRRQLAGALDKIRNGQADPAFRDLADGLSLLDRHVAGLKKYAWDLRPPDLSGIGLKTAIKNLYTDASEKMGLGVSFQFDLRHDCLDPEASIIIFRVAQEALNNVLAHSAATSVSLRLYQHDGSIRLLVCDDGKGFCPERRLRGNRKSIGLRSMKEMAETLGGQVKVRSAAGKGTSVSLTLPARLGKQERISS